MKVTTVLLAILGFSYGRPQFEPQLQAQQQFQQAAPIYITRYVNDYQDNNNYYYLYEQSDGQRKEETGEFRSLGPQPEDQILGVRGSYSYVGPDGVTYSVSYTADENGFQPEGDHIPPAAGVRPKLGISSAAIASLAG